MRKEGFSEWCARLGWRVVPYDGAALRRECDTYVLEVAHVDTGKHWFVVVEPGPPAQMLATIERNLRKAAESASV